jgi:hypothetical protein
MRNPLPILLLLLLPAAAHAFQVRLADSTNTLVLPAGETLAGETMLIAQSLDMHGTARRDLWLLSGAAARFDGLARGDLRMLAGSAVVAGEARQNLLIYARGLHLTTNSVVRGQAALFGATVVCEGSVAGDAWIFAQSVTLAGHWGGTVRVRAAEIRIAPGTHIAGDLVYTTPKTLVYDPSVSIGGAVVPRADPLHEARGLSPTATRARFAFHGYLFLAALLVGMPFVGFFPLTVGGAVRNLRSSPWRVLFAGTLTVLLGPFLAAFALMTLVGIPLALLLAAFYAALVYLSHIVVALWLGHLLLRSPGPQSFARVLSALSAGLFVLYFATALPGVSAFVALPVVILGTGALILAILRRPLVSIPLPPPPPVPQPPPPPEVQE